LLSPPLLHHHHHHRHYHRNYSTITAVLSLKIKNKSVKTQLKIKTKININIHTIFNAITTAITITTAIIMLLPLFCHYRVLFQLKQMYTQH
jgi:superoxide dismutase